MSETAATIEQPEPDLTWVDAGNWEAMKAEGFRYFNQLSEPESDSGFDNADYLDRIRRKLGPENVVIGEAFDFDTMSPVKKEGKRGIYIRR